MFNYYPCSVVHRPVLFHPQLHACCLRANPPTVWTSNNCGAQGIFQTRSDQNHSAQGWVHFINAIRRNEDRICGEQGFEPASYRRWVYSVVVLKDYYYYKGWESLCDRSDHPLDEQRYDPFGDPFGDLILAHADRYLWYLVGFRQRARPRLEWFHYCLIR